MFTIDREKFLEIVKLFKSQVDSEATTQTVFDEITSDWNEGEEHQIWLTEAKPQEIVDWLASFK